MYARAEFNDEGEGGVEMEERGKEWGVGEGERKTIW